MVPPVDTGRVGISIQGEWNLPPALQCFPALQHPPGRAIPTSFTRPNLCPLHGVRLDQPGPQEKAGRGPDPEETEEMRLAAGAGRQGPCSVGLGTVLLVPD